MAIIEVNDLVKTYRVHRKPQGLRASVKALFRRQYKTVRAVDGISFEIQAGEMVGFLGPNGAGKTTTLKMLSGLIFPTSGSVRALGYVPWERRNEYRRRFALVMGQKNQLWWDLPAIESFQLHKEIYAIAEEPFQEVLEELTDLLEVRDLLNQPVRELSLGERMKMELIAALLHSPSIVYLDEPTIGLDVVAQAAIRDCLREYNRRRQITVLITSHYMQDIEALCDRVLVINKGLLMHDGPLGDIVGRFATHKLVTLRFVDGNVPDRLEEFGEIQDFTPPRVILRVPRDAVARLTGDLLATHEVTDLSVEDPPIEAVIARVYGGETGDEQAAAEEDAVVGGR